MTRHKIRIRRWRGLKEMYSLRAHQYPPEGSEAWWLTCYAPGCLVNRGTWVYGHDVALHWALKHRYYAEMAEEWRP